MSEEKKQDQGKKKSAKLTAEQRDARRWKLYGVLTVVVIVLIAALLFWDSGFIQKRATALTVGDRNYTAADLDYYYFSQYNSIQPYASYYGLDTSVSLKDQEAYEGTSWYDYLLDAAKTNLVTVSTLAQEGEAAGYEMSEEGQKNYDSTMQDLADACEEYNVSRSYYLHQLFGRFMTEPRFEKLMQEYFYAYDYQSNKTENFEVTDSDIQSYYNDNKDTLDTFNYQCYLVDAKPATEYDDDGNEIKATEEEIATAAAEAHAVAEQLEAALQSGDESAVQEIVAAHGCQDYSDVEADSFSSYPFGEWMVDAARKAGDTTVVEDVTTETVEDEEDPADTSGDSSAAATDPADSSAAATDPADSSAAATDPADASGDSSASGAAQKTVERVTGYYVARFDRRFHDDYHAPTFRNLLIPAQEKESDDEDSSETTYDYDAAKAKAEELQATWKKNGGTEEAFTTLTDETIASSEEEDGDEDDTDSVTYSGGLNENVEKGTLDSAVEEWAYDPSRKAGDCAVVQDETNQGYQLLYFVKLEDLYYWQTVAKENLQSEAYSDWYEEVSKNYEPSQTWFFHQVG